jgi:hypothetical protein
MLLNTSRSIFKKPDAPVEPVAAGANPSPGEALGGSNALAAGAAGMPDQEQRPQEDGPDDESSEGDPDREGNTDPGTNAPPEPNDDQGELELTPEEIRQQAILDAHAKIQVQAMNQAAADLPEPDVMTAPIRLQQFKYLSMTRACSMSPARSQAAKRSARQSTPGRT